MYPAAPALPQASPPSSPGTLSTCASACRLVDFDVDRNLVRVEHKGVQLVVDRELVPGLQVQRGSTFQFIGEVTHFQPTLQLRARVARIVDGLDTELYDMALVRPPLFALSRPRVFLAAAHWQLACGLLLGRAAEV